MSLAISPRLFVSVFGLIFVAELPDKTAFATLLLATRKHPVAVFIGVAAAFVIQSLIAVTFGTALSVLPRQPVKITAGLLFLGFAVAMWLRNEPVEDEFDIDAKKRASFAHTAWTSFVVIFIAEWGDLTQLATATLAAKHGDPLTIFLSATLALWTVTAIAIAVGHQAKLRLNPRVLQKVAAVAFCIVGAVILRTA